MADYIVVPVADAQLARVGLCMLYAQKYEMEYPLPGPTLYIWDPVLNTQGTHAAFGPADSLGGEDADFGEWCLGKTIETADGPFTCPTELETLAASWFPPPPPGPYSRCVTCTHMYMKQPGAVACTVANCTCTAFVAST
jgi:hypothetical protein